MRAPHPDDFTSRLRSPAVAARVGVWLGVAFVVCFATGLISHWAQLPRQPVPFPTSPSWGYRLTQGIHVLSGSAAVPLLLVKLWSVQHRLFERPDLARLRPLLLTIAERASIGVLVAAALFQLATGLANAAQWYPWSSFSFRPTHYALAWVAIGALVLHVAVKLPVIRDALGRHPDDPRLDRPAQDAPARGAMGRRTLVGSGLAAAGVAVLTNAGGAVTWLRDVSVLATRSGDGPAGVPINRSAEAAGVSSVGDDYRLRVVVDGVERARLSQADLRALPQHTEDLPIACVEGWSAPARWTGVPVRDLLASVGAPTDSDVAVSSMERSGAFASSVLPAEFVADARTLLALDLSGQPLDLDHGSPCRVIAPNRPGVLQTKWVSSLEVST